jgi:hypothetical protein
MEMSSATSARSVNRDAIWKTALWYRSNAERAERIRYGGTINERRFMGQDDRIAGLVRQIEAAKKRERVAMTAGQLTALQRQGASELHSLCARFVESVNRRLSGGLLELSPPVYEPGMFQPSGVNLFQVGSDGREIHVAFQAARDLVSTEKFLIPYVLEGEVRAFNQQMLDRFEVRSRLLFYCLEEDRAVWRFFDWRTRHTGLFGAELLLSLMESLFA